MNASDLDKRGESHLKSPGLFFHQLHDMPIRIPHEYAFGKAESVLWNGDAPGGYPGKDTRPYLLGRCDPNLPAHWLCQRR